MFKKPVKVSAQNQLSGKDRKVTKSKLADSLDNDCIQKIFNANQKIISCKISGAKMLIYNGDQYPLFVDGTGKHNYFPSLYVATAYQPLIKTLTINEGVQAYIYNGANLMWPGVRNFQGLGQFSKDQTVGIRNSKGQIIAIGAMGCGKKQMNDNNGVAVYILHYLGDKLWQMGSKTFPQVVVPLKVQESKVQQVKAAQVKKQQAKKQQVKQQKSQQPKSQAKDKKAQTTKQTESKKKQKSPSPKKQSSQSSQSDDNDDFMGLVHSKNQNKRVVKMQPKGKAKNAFVQDENQQKNAKNKKKQGKAVEQQKPKPKGKGKKQQSEDQDVMQEQQDQPKKNKKDNKKDNKKGGKNKGKQQKKPNKKQQSGSEDEDQQNKKQKIQQGKTQKDNESDQQQGQKKGQQKSAINSKLMDEYFKQSMLNAIKLTKIQAELPIDSGRFYMDFMLLARPEGVKLDIKQSSYKKIGKFFQQMAKKKFIQYKHPKDKKAQGATINKIFWQNQQIKNHVPTVKKLGSKQEQQKVQSYSKAKLKLSKTVTLQTVYKPSQQLFNEILKAPLNLMPAEGQKQVTDKQEIQFVTQKQLRQKIQKYINKMVDSKQKDGPKKVEKNIIIEYSKNAFIRELLKKQIQEYEENKEKDTILKAQDQYDSEQEKKKKKNKKGYTQKECIRIQRSYLVQKIMKKATPQYHVYDKQNGLDIFKQGTFKGIQLTAEKANNKNVTRIVGLQLFITPRQEADDQIHGLANLFQTKFACSVNVQNLPGKNAGKEIVVHGAFLDELQQMLTVEYQLPSKFITTQNKLDKKKKN